MRTEGTQQNSVRTTDCGKPATLAANGDGLAILTICLSHFSGETLLTPVSLTEVSCCTRTFGYAYVDPHNSAAIFEEVIDDEFGGVDTPDDADFDDSFYDDDEEDFLDPDERYGHGDID